MAAKVPANPSARPTARQPHAVVEHQGWGKLAVLVPSAARMPISRVRFVIVYDITPKSPTAASTMRDCGATTERSLLDDAVGQRGLSHDVVEGADIAERLVGFNAIVLLSEPFPPVTAVRRLP